MRELGGMSYADMASALGVTIPAVKSLLVRARLALGQAIAARDTACSEIRDELMLSHAFLNGVLIHRSESDPDARAVVTKLLERCLDGGGPREPMIELLHTWRERSSAPLHARQVLQAWLGYSFQPPKYSDRH